MIYMMIVALAPTALLIALGHVLRWRTALLPEATEGLEAYCADLTRIEVPGADHWVIHQETDAVADHIRDWLQR